MKSRTKAELMSQGLPKWPQMFVTGKNVSMAQAKEIIRRTDSFFDYPEYAGNDRAYSRRVMEAVGYPQNLEHMQNSIGDGTENFQNYLYEIEDWRESWGCIETSYVCNSWIACAFIGGPHGWCNPDGRIWYTDNVGKWPSIEEVLDEWKILANAFPFVEAGVTLMSASDCEDDRKPVVSMRVKNGKVRLVDPLATNVHAGAEAPLKDIELELHGLMTQGTAREQGIPFAWIEEWAKEHG